VIPVTVRVVHPLAPRVTSLFCGELAPKGEWKGVVPLARHEGSGISLKTVKTSQPFLRASITGPARDQLAVSLVAPDKPGRSQEYVELIFDDQRLPPLRIPVAFVVARY
jgi:hypothetical protein